MSIHPKVEEFIAFCNAQKPDREYLYSCTRQCALGEFNRYNSVDWEHEFAHCDHMAGFTPHTFGALTARLKRWYTPEMAA